MRREYTRGMRHIIGHVDMDAFFASIEERDNSRLAGRPIVVGADPQRGHGRGVVSTANYKAREYGIRSALPISKAWQFSEEARRRGLPPAVFMEVNMEKYADVSERVMAILHMHAKIVEEASVDEAYIDLSAPNSYEKATEIAIAIKKDIKEKERLTATVGIGPNRLIAKIASDRQKPDGLTVVCEEEVESFLEPLPIRVIPGIGPKTEEQFQKLGIKTINDAKRFSAQELKTLMGKRGIELYERLRGRASAELIEVWDQKSIGEQTTFAHDIPADDSAKHRKMLEAAMADLAADVARRFSTGGFASFKGIAITVRFSDFATKTRAVTLPKPIFAADSSEMLRVLQFQALRLFMPFLDRRENPERKAIRLLGVRVEKFSENIVSQSLF